MVWLSRGFERMTGLSRNEASGRNCRYLQTDGTDPAAIAQVSPDPNLNPNPNPDPNLQKADGTDPGRDRADEGRDHGGRADARLHLEPRPVARARLLEPDCALYAAAPACSGALDASVDQQISARPHRAARKDGWGQAPLPESRPEPRPPWLAVGR